MDFSSAVQWWEGSQMRVLVLSSLVVQYLLFFTAPQRKLAIPSWFRSLIWLAYLGGDGLAIYALAALFNRHRNSSTNNILEVVWAPVLLIHLGGQDSITAISVEDNELWRRHILTSVSQVTIAIYVFRKSWPGGDNRLLQAAILLFTTGILKCFEKPFALKRASINSLVSSPHAAARRDEMLLEDYVKEIAIITREEVIAVEQQEDILEDIEASHPPQAQTEGVAVEPGQADESSTTSTRYSRRRQKMDEIRSLGLDDKALNVFVDHVSAYRDRLNTLRSFWVLDEEKAYELLQNVITNTFDALYTKAKLTSLQESVSGGLLNMLADNIRIANAVLTFVAIALFHNSHREVYNEDDVKVTYTLICCTAVLGLFTHNGRLFRMRTMVSQYSLVGFFARNKKHVTMMCIVSCFGCKDLLDQRWCMKSCSSSRRITKLVLGYVRVWWKLHIVNSASYRRFNDSRGQWTIHRHVQDSHGLLGWSLKRPFDESVLLWHIVTDLCFYVKGRASPDHRCTSSQCEGLSSDELAATWCKRSPWFGTAMGCREMSNYMMYLLFVNPEMLIAGARRNLFTTAYAELNKILEGGEPFLEERAITQSIIAKMESLQEPQEGNFIHDAWKLAEGLVKLGDEKKMWEVIEGVWVEMLCFSASRGRGYLHAKALGNGGELLTYVWLLLYNMGMETLPERLQREDLATEAVHASQRAERPSGGENTDAFPSTSEDRISPSPIL